MGTDNKATNETAKDAANEVKFLDTLNALGLMLDTDNAKKYNDAFKPHYASGKLLGVVEECKEGSRDRTDNVTSYRVKIAIPTDGTRKDFAGRVNTIMQGYWVNSYEPIELNTVIEIKSNDYAVVLNRGTHEESNSDYVLKEFMPKKELINDNKELREGYKVVLNTDMSKGGAMVTTIQKNKFVVLERMQKVELDV